MRLLLSRLARAALFAAALCVTLAPRSASATVVVPITRAEMVDRSDLVVRAAVLDRRTSWNADHTQVVTLTRLRVQSYLKGTGPQELVLRQFGGMIDGFTMVVPGDAQLAQGQDVVLFLRRGEGPIVFLTALAMSAYHVVHSPGVAPTVFRDLHDLTFARQQNGRMVLAAPPAEPTETLDHLAAEVAALAAGAR